MALTTLNRAAQTMESRISSRAPLQRPGQNPSMDSFQRPGATNQNPRINELQKQEQGALGEQFKNLRTSTNTQLGAAQAELDRRQKEELDRSVAATGGFGGAEMKLRQEAGRQSAEDFSQQKTQAMSDIGAAEAGAKQESLARYQQMAQSDEQFSKQFGLAQEQFKAATDQWNQEFDENVKTNMIMALLNFRKAGLDSSQYTKYYPVISSVYSNDRYDEQAFPRPKGNFVESGW